MKPAAVARAEALLGARAETWARVARRGYSLNEHWTVGFADGTRAFLKEGHVDPSPGWVRDEHAVFGIVSGPFMPRLLGYEDGEHPLLVLEELMPAHWPPPWRDGDVALVLEALGELSRAEVRGELPANEHLRAWRHVASEPKAFLSTGLRDGEWLEARLPQLLAAEDATPIAGDSLLHCDVRSDNLCVKEGRVVLVDWNHARIGNARYDVAFWAPSLALERGPLPDELGVDEFAVYVAGFFAARAGLPRPPGAPLVRDFQRAQAEVALDWAERVLLRAQ